MPILLLRTRRGYVGSFLLCGARFVRILKDVSIRLANKPRDINSLSVAAMMKTTTLSQSGTNRWLLLLIDRRRNREVVRVGP